MDTTAEVHDALPGELTYVPGSLSCGIGACRYDAGAITWEGAVRGKSMAPIRFQATVSADAWPGQQITNAATVHDRTTGQSHAVAATVRLPGAARQTFFLPIVPRVVRRGAVPAGRRLHRRHKPCRTWGAGQSRRGQTPAQSQPSLCGTEDREPQGLVACPADRAQHGGLTPCEPGSATNAWHRGVSRMPSNDPPL